MHCVRRGKHPSTGPAHTEDTAYYYFAPGTGVVAVIMQEDAEAAPDRPAALPGRQLIALE